MVTGLKPVALWTSIENFRMLRPFGGSVSCEGSQQHQGRDDMVEPAFGRVLAVQFGVTIGGVSQMFPAKSFKEAANTIQFLWGWPLNVKGHGDRHGHPPSLTSTFLSKHRKRGCRPHRAFPSPFAIRSQDDREVRKPIHRLRRHQGRHIRCRP